MSRSRSIRTDRADDGEDQPAVRSAGVDAEVEDAQRDPVLVEVVEQATEIAGVAAAAGQFDHDEGVASAQVS